MYPQKECNNICITHALYTYNTDMYDVYTTANLRCEAAKRKQQMLGQYVQSVYYNTYFKKQISTISTNSQVQSVYQQISTKSKSSDVSNPWVCHIVLSRHIMTYQQNILRLVESPSPRRLSNCDAVYSIRTPMISCDGTIQVLRSNQNGEHVGFNMI